MRPLMLLVLGLAALAFAACTTSTPPTTEVDQDTGTEFPVSPAAEERSLDQDRSTNPNPDPTYHASTPNPIDVVYSTVASLPSGDPLSPLFGDRPEHGVAIDRLSSALKSAIVITPTEHLRANSRGRFLKIHYRDGVELRVRSVSWCEQWSGGKDFVGGFCSGEHRQLEDSWWVEGIGIVRSPALRSWWEDMPTFMVPIGSRAQPTDNRRLTNVIVSRSQAVESRYTLMNVASMHWIHGIESAVTPGHIEQILRLLVRGGLLPVRLLKLLMRLSAG